MQLSKQDQQNHHALAQYVRYALPKLGNIGAVVKAMHTHGLLTAQEFSKALTWGELPLIKIVDSGVAANSCAGSTGWYGCNRNANEIEIALFVVDDFEQDPTGKGTEKKPGGNVYSLGATILHELCHWGYQLKGVSQTGIPEVGRAFEKALYGVTI